MPEIELEHASDDCIILEVGKSYLTAGGLRMDVLELNGIPDDSVPTPEEDDSPYWHEIQESVVFSTQLYQMEWYSGALVKWERDTNITGSAYICGTSYTEDNRVIGPWLLGEAKETSKHKKMRMERIKHVKSAKW